MERGFNIVMWVAVVLSGLTVLAIVVMTSMNMREVGECARWSRDAERYPEYYLTHWQKEQCDAHGIFINAPVK